MRTYKFRIYPTVQQKQILDNTIETCRLLYNECLEERNKEKLSRFDQQRMLTVKKRDRMELRSVYSQVLQDVILRLDKTFKRFFSKISNYPKFKRFGRYNSITYPQWGGFRIRYNKLCLSKIGSIKINMNRIPIGTLKTCIIIRDIDRWFACIVTTNNLKKFNSYKKGMVGIDLGLTNWISLSNGEIIDRPRFMSKSIDKIKKLQRELSRKKKGSKNREKTRIQLAKAWRKVRLQREDYCHKVSTNLAKKYSMIVLEKLRINNMVKQHTLANSIHDSTWYKLKQLAAYKAEVIEVDPKNTTQRCSNCGGLPENKIGLEIRIYECQYCGLILNRDINAAKNILKLGQELTLVERKPLSVISEKKEKGKLLSMKQEVLN